MEYSEQMLEKYGPLLTMSKAAQILDRSVDGFRSSLSRNNDPVALKLKRIRISIGRRVYFPTDQFFEVVLSSRPDNG